MIEVVCPLAACLVKDVIVILASGVHVHIKR